MGGWVGGLYLSRGDGARLAEHTNGVHGGVVDTHLLKWVGGWVGGLR